MASRIIVIATVRRVSRQVARWFMAIAVALSGLTLATESPPDAAVATQAQAILEQTTRPDGPGLELLIARGDRVIFHAARGSAEIELGVPLRTGQVYRIASITKIFTAAEIVKLAEEHQLSLDDTLDRYLPDFPGASRIHLRQLLNHTAGISDIAKNPQPGFFARKFDTAALLAQVAERDPAFTPGTQQSYSNGGYIVLGAVIEKVTGKPWHEAIREQLLEPLGLRQTGYGDNATLIPGRVAGYTTDTPDHSVRNASYIHASVPAAAGAFVSTANDLFHWMHALTDGKVIGTAWFAQMSTPPTLPTGVAAKHPYGLGLYLWQVRGKPMIGHTGQIDGFASAVAYVPSAQVTVVVLANDDNADARTMARRLAALALGEPYDTPVAIALSNEELDALQGSYRIDDKTLETLSVKDGQLLAQRTGRHAVPLQSTAQGRLYFVPDELSYFQPVHDAQGKVIRLDYVEGGDAPAQSWPRVDIATSP
nr:serine hydrolase domain-containing protein [Dyella sp. ASV24]